MYTDMGRDTKHVGVHLQEGGREMNSVGECRDIDWKKIADVAR